MITVPKYLSCDGVEFDSPLKCLKYETDNNIDSGVDMYNSYAIEILNGESYNYCTYMHIRDIKKAAVFFNLIPNKNVNPPKENGYFSLVRKPNPNGSVIEWEKITKDVFDYIVKGD